MMMIVSINFILVLHHLVFVVVQIELSELSAHRFVQQSLEAEDEDFLLLLGVEFGGIEIVILRRIEVIIYCH